MRHDKAAALLELARRLAGSAEGLTLDEMAAAVGVDRRTAERMRDRIADLFPQLEVVADPPTKRWRIPAGLDGFMQAPTADELAALGSAAAEHEVAGARVRAAALRTLETKVLSALRAPARRRIAPDLEALLQAEAIAVQAGPRPFEDEAMLGAVREALKGGRRLRFRYFGGSTPGREREVVPYGLLFGRSNYLVAAESAAGSRAGSPRNWRLDRIEDVTVQKEAGSRPDGFSLQAYADQSFGIYQDDVEDVVLRIGPDGASAALRWRFHVGQIVEPQADGAVRVSFRASGMRELAWHLFTWGADVRVEQPPRLRALLVDQLRAALAAHDARVTAVLRRSRPSWLLPSASIAAESRPRRSASRRRGRTLQGKLQMNQSELVAHVAQTAELDKSQAAKAVDTTLGAIAQALKAGDKVSLLGLGVFEINERPARKGRNPATGASIDIAASKAVKFRPSKVLKDAVSPPAEKAKAAKAKA